MNWDATLRLRHIRCFLEIARTESVSQAADHLNITQPAVSRTLRELEEMLAVRLFDRVGRGLRLNEAGRIFQAHAVASMVELMRGRDRLAKGGDARVRLSIGVLPTAATDLVPRAALQFREEAPHTRLHILTGPNWLLFNQLRDGAIDLVVGRMPDGAMMAGLAFEQLRIENVLLVCRPGHPALSEGEAGRRIANYPLVMPPRGAIIAPPVDRYLASIGLPEMRGAFETVALPVGRKIVQESDALWFISEGVVADELQAGTLVAVDLTSPLLAGPTGVSVSRSASLSVERTLFVECLRRIARPLAASPE